MGGSGGPGRPPRPPIPAGCKSLREFGTTIMRWGTGSAAARARLATLTRDELEQAGVTLEIAEAWRDFYQREMSLNPRNPSAAGRAELLRRAAELLAGGH